MKQGVAFVLALMILGSSAAGQAPYTTFELIPNGGIYPDAINSRCATAGDYFTLSSPESFRAFYRDPAGQLTTFGGPNAVQTNTTGMTEDGVVVGYYLTSAAAAPQHGFIRYPDGRFETVDAPGSAGTLLWAVTSTGTQIGTAFREGRSQGFLRTNTGPSDVLRSGSCGQSLGTQSGG